MVRNPGAVAPWSLDGASALSAAERSSSALVAYLALEGTDAWMRRHQDLSSTGKPTALPPRRLALLIAIGIGLHNLGGGLAIGSAYAVGSLALGATLIVGFAIPQHHRRTGHRHTAGQGTRSPGLARGRSARKSQRAASSSYIFRAAGVGCRTLQQLSRQRLLHPRSMWLMTFIGSR